MVLADIARGCRDARIHYIPRDHAEVFAQPAVFCTKYFSSHVNTEGGGEALPPRFARAGEEVNCGGNPAKTSPPERQQVNPLLPHGIMAARRTVAKYRESIPPSNQRKQLV
ncbi:RNA polymerase subunit sigma-54 [Salmonella enterica subsp. enterica]|nr:RNA polymerase subunit sigma-54 [Salmonella enterica subsp. enterica]